MRTRYKITQKDGLYFITSTIVEWLPVFTNKNYFEIIIDTLKFCQKNKGLNLFAFVIFDNHFHLIVSAPDLSKTLASIRKFTDKEIIRQLEENNKKWLLNELTFYKKKYKTESNYQVWQEGYHPQLINSGEMMIQKVEYIHYNPVKRGLVDLPEQWRYSSARNHIFNDNSIIDVESLPI